MGFGLELAASSVAPLPLGEVGLRSDPGEGLRPIDRLYPLTPGLSLWERELTGIAATSVCPLQCRDVAR